MVQAKFQRCPMIIQSGVIPYFIENDTVKYVLITSTRKPNRWIFPKGMLEPNMLAWESAVKEGIEEAGVYGEVSTDVCAHYQYKKWSSLCQVDMYLLRVVDIAQYWEEAALRRRRVCTYDEAFGLIFKRVKPALFAAQQQIQSL